MIAATCVALAAATLGGCATPQRWQSTLVTHNAAATNSGNGPSTDPVISADGTKVAFLSDARNFGLPDTNGMTDVFVHDLTTGQVTLVSVNRLGTNSGNAPSGSPAISPDGTKVAFRSEATNLQDLPVTHPVRGRHVYVRDLLTGTTTLVTVEIGGTGGFSDPYSVPVGELVFSPDGSKLAFESGKADLVPDDPTPSLSAADVFVRDLATETTVLVSRSTIGSPGNGHSRLPRFSPDGTTVAFESTASNLVAGDVNAAPDVFLRNLGTGTTSLLVPGANGSVGEASWRPDGGAIAFSTYATNLGAPDGNGNSDVFVRDLTTGADALLSVRQSDAGTGDGGSFRPTFSPDGTRVAFESDATDLVAGDGNEEGDVFVRRLDTGETSLVSTQGDGSGSGAAGSRRPRFAGDGRVVFESLAWDLGPKDTNNEWDLYLRDLAGGVTSLVSARADGTDSGDDASIAGSVAGDRVAYQSRATDLDPTDTNGTWDIYFAMPYQEPPSPTTTTDVPPTTTEPPSTTTEVPPTTTEPPPTTEPPTTTDPVPTVDGS